MIEKMLGEPEAIGVTGIVELWQAGEDQAQIGGRPVAASPVPGGGFDMMEKARVDRGSTGHGKQGKQSHAIRTEGELSIIRHADKAGTRTKDKAAFANLDRLADIGGPQADRTVRMDLPHTVKIPYIAGLSSRYGFSTESVI